MALGKMLRECRPDVFGTGRAANMPDRCRRTIRPVWRRAESWELSTRHQPDSLAERVHDLLENVFRQTHPAYDKAGVNEPSQTKSMFK